MIETGQTFGILRFVILGIILLAAILVLARIPKEKRPKMPWWAVVLLLLLAIGLVFFFVRIGWGAWLAE